MVKKLFFFVILSALIAASCAPPAQAPGPPAPGEVNIVNFAFSPSTLTVTAGTTVKWTNTGSASHTVTSVSGAPSFGSGTITPGSSFSQTFATAGSYQYHCSFHPAMTGTIVVTQ